MNGSTLTWSFFPLQTGILVWNKFTFWHPTPGSNSHRRSLGGSHHHTLHGFYEWFLVGWHQLEIARFLLGVWMARKITKSGVELCGTQQLEGMTWLGIAMDCLMLQNPQKNQPGATNLMGCASWYCVSTPRSTAKWEPMGTRFRSEHHFGCPQLAGRALWSSCVMRPHGENRTVCARKSRWLSTPRPTLSYVDVHGTLS